VLPSNPTLAASRSVGGRRASGSLSQPLSLTGEGAAARDVARADILAAEARLDRARRVAAADVRRSYAETVVRCGQVTVAEDGVAIAARLRDAVGLQHVEGEASLLDLRLARLALVQASARLLDAREAEAQALRSLADKLGDSPTCDQLAPDPLLTAPVARPPHSSDRSDVRAAVASLDAAHAALRRERARAWAPIQVGAFVSVEDDAAFAGPSISLQLPIFDRNQSQQGAAEGAVASRAADHARLVARAATEQRTARLRSSEADALQAALGADPLEEAREALVSIEEGYRAGELDLASTVLLQDQVLDGEAATLALLGGIARARLDLLLATDDDRLLAPSSNSRSAP
jgi:outer membrane protein TolC